MPVLRFTHRLWPALLLVLLLVLTACGLAAPTVVQFDEGRYPPRPVIERLRTEPARPHVIIAELSQRSSSLTRAEVEAQLAESARQLGADAIVFRRSSRGELDNPVPQSKFSESFTYRAVAIRYR